MLVGHLNAVKHKSISRGRHLIKANPNPGIGWQVIILFPIFKAARCTI